MRHDRSAALRSLILAAALLAAGTPPADAQERTLRHGGRDRSYVVRVPYGVTRTSAPMPVVVVLHGGGGNAANAEQMTGFTRLVDAERIMVVYPNGTGRRRTDRLLTWNAVHCCGSAMEDRVDDVGFVAAILDTLAAQYPVDANRIYATGMSNGAMMTHRLGRELSRRFAAIAPVVGTVFGDEAAAAHGVNAVIFNGFRDKNVPPQGGLGSGLGRRAWDGVPAKPFLDQGNYWARVDDCLPTPTLEELGKVLHWTWHCAPGRTVELYQVKDNGHAWPGGKAGSQFGDKPSRAIDATAVMWAFFKAHPRAP